MQSGKIYGYARVSSKHQNEERQLIALRAFGIRDRDIYCDRQSGKDFDRPNYQRLLLRLQAGDVFVVKSIDRLGRNYNEILYQWRQALPAAAHQHKICRYQGGRLIWLTLLRSLAVLAWRFWVPLLR